MLLFLFCDNVIFSSLNKLHILHLEFKSIKSATCSLSFFFFTFHRKKKKRVLNVDEKKQTETSEGGNNDADDRVQTEKSDKLWASFLSDVGTRPKDSTPSEQSQTAQTVTVT